MEWVAVYHKKDWTGEDLQEAVTSTWHWTHVSRHWTLNSAAQCIATNLQKGQSQNTLQAITINNGQNTFK